ncbi:hypothetical protein CEXT_39731 [Caerostris extrusa]|uniref:Uncharacterized protein n=1 Tax=Caerostris extrusa TaxID=172846 RepID=A0AAV4MGE9_CAEEX|nr:hypothetical protein CEXT_39731 [Caerostris extrusa]
METDDIEGNGPFQVRSEVPSEPTAPEKPSNPSDEERCARISRMLKWISQNLLDTVNDGTLNHALDEDDCIKLKALEQDLINALREVGNLELCPMIDCTKHKANVNLKNNASQTTAVNDNPDCYSKPPKKLTAKVSHNTIETKNLYDKLNIDEQEEVQDPSAAVNVKKCHS